MDYGKSKKKIFPLKISDAFYNNLKYVAKNEGLPVAAFIRKQLEPIVEKHMKAEKKKRSKKMTLKELAEKYTWRGKTYFEDKSVDEILYGRKLHEDEK